MSYILLVLLLFEIFLIYKCNGENVVSPSFISCAMFILSIFVFLLGKNYFKYSLNLLTIITIFVFLFCILLGEYTSNYINTRYIKEETMFEYIYVQKSVCVLLALLVFTFGIIYFIEVYRFSLKVGNFSGNWATMAMYVRESKMYSKSTLVSQGTLLSECIFYFCIYCFFNNLNCGKKEMRFFIPIIAFFPHIMAADNRTTLLKILSISCIMIFALMKKKSHWEKQNNGKIVIFAALVIVVFLCAFRLLGYRTETSIRNSLWNNLMEYISASLVGLDQYLLQIKMKNTLVGQWTLAGIYNILRQWGVNIPIVDKFEPFFSYGDIYKSNIYTAFKAYIQDYTYLGGMVAMYLWGYFITNKLNSVKRGHDDFYHLCVLGLFFYPVAMISIEDVTSSVICMQTVYMLIYLKIIEYFFIKRGVTIGREMKTINEKGRSL